MTHQRISSVAIAGAWGYIGRKFLDAAVQLGLATSVYDIGTPPGGLALQDVTIFDNEQKFYQQRSDLFHLALHPEHRAGGFEALLHRSHSEPICVLCEKPMAAPESPGDCESIVRAIDQSQAFVLFDFPELFDPITRQILAFLQQHDDVTIDSIVQQRSKDREDPTIERNKKRMVHIQYQESVHCLAFALYLLGHVQGGLEQVLEQGLSAHARSLPYRPPNPSAYPYVVDGMCEYQISLGRMQVHGLTDFTSGAPWTKRREIKGRADGHEFLIEADYLEGEKRLRINGTSYDQTVRSNSYEEVIKSISQLRQAASAQEIASGLYPNASFARTTYQLSSVLWRASWDRKAIQLASLAALLDFDAQFAEAAREFKQY